MVTDAREAAGAEKELWRYPVKSMLGQRLAAVQVTEVGLAGDRRLALIDLDSGKIASAKAPRLWRDLSPRDVMALRTLAEHNQIPAMPGFDPAPCAGVYAQVVAPGRISPGDRVLIGEG